MLSFLFMIFLKFSIASICFFISPLSVIFRNLDYTWHSNTLTLIWMPVYILAFKSFPIFVTVNFAMSILRDTSCSCLLSDMNTFTQLGESVYLLEAFSVYCDVVCGYVLYCTVENTSLYYGTMFIRCCSFVTAMSCRLYTSSCWSH